MPLRTAFMGTPELALPSLRILAQGSDLALVVTQPDRPAGRGMHLKPPPVKVLAQELGIPVWQPESLAGAATDPRFNDLDLIVVLAYGEILEQALLDRPRLGCVNLHFSLLPRWRGASPMQAALRAGDRETGVSVARMVRKLDAGPVYFREPLVIPPKASLAWLHDVLAELAAQALGRHLCSPEGLTPQPQNRAEVTLCRKLTHDDGRLDWMQPAAAVERHVRAYTPAPGCWTMADGERVRILEVDADAAVADLAPGHVRVDHHRMWIGCGEAAVSVAWMQPAGKRAMRIADFLNGHRPPERCI